MDVLDEALSNTMSRAWCAPWRDELRRTADRRVDPRRHGDLPKWLAALRRLPEASPSAVHLDRTAVTVGQRDDLHQDARRRLIDGLRTLHPWRKGPFDLFGVPLDAEWRSNRKWDRLDGRIASLKGRRVIDIGCGNGYYLWRMLGAGAEYVLGIDPSLKFFMQFLAINRYIDDPRIDFLPLAGEDLPGPMRHFDTVFSMGVIYHRRNPREHLRELAALLRPGGELVLETLVVEQHPEGVLIPDGRYAQMRNVWFIPTPKHMQRLLRECGFSAVRCGSVDVTSVEEQRRTDWMRFHSLAQFLDPHDPSRTVEGYPAPARGIFIAELTKPPAASPP